MADLSPGQFDPTDGLHGHLLAEEIPAEEYIYARIMRGEGIVPFLNCADRRSGTLTVKSHLSMLGTNATDPDQPGRAYGDRVPKGRTYKPRKIPFECQDHSVGKDIDRLEELDALDESPIEDKARESARDTVIKGERRVERLCMTDANWGTNYDLSDDAGGFTGVPWDQEGSRPIADCINLARRFRFDSEGGTGDLFIMPSEIAVLVAGHAETKGYHISAGGVIGIGETHLSEMDLIKLLATKMKLNPKRILIPGGMFNAAGIGEASDVGEIWNKSKCWFGKCAGGRIRMTKPGASGYEVAWADAATLRGLAPIERRDDGLVKQVRFDDVSSQFIVAERLGSTVGGLTAA